MDKPIPEAVRALIDEARRAACVLRLSAHPRQSPHEKPLLEAAAKAEAALTAAQQQGQAVASLEGFREPVTLWGKAYEYDRHGREAVVERRKPIVAELLRIIDTAPPSAPVGVEAEVLPAGAMTLIEDLKAAHKFNVASLVPSAVHEKLVQLQHALAQQPAAVDEARAMELWDEFREAGHHERDALICVLQALATQHQEPTT